MEYRVEQQPETFLGTTYCGYIDGEYAGTIVGQRKAHWFDISHSTLAPKFRGTKAVRALKEILAVVMENNKVVRTRIDNRDNAEIKMILSVGFHIIGTVTYGSEIAVELLKIREA